MPLTKLTDEMAVEGVHVTPPSIPVDLKQPLLSHSGDLTDTTASQNIRKAAGSTISPENESKVSRPKPSFSKEAPIITGCGLQASAAVVKVSQIKQVFEASSSSVTASPEESRKTESYFPEEDIPEVAIHPDQYEELVAKDFVEDITLLPNKVTISVESGDTQIQTKAKSVSPKVPQEPFQTICTLEKDTERSMFSDKYEGERPLTHGDMKQFVSLSEVGEGKQSPQLVRPEPVRPGQSSHSSESVETVSEDQSIKDKTVRTFDRTSSFIPFERVPVAKSLSNEVVKQKRISESLIAQDNQDLETMSSTACDVTEIIGDISTSAPSQSGVGVSVCGLQSEITEATEDIESHAKGSEVPLESKPVCVNRTVEGPPKFALTDSVTEQVPQEASATARQDVGVMEATIQDAGVIEAASQDGVAAAASQDAGATKVTSQDSVVAAAKSLATARQGVEVTAAASQGAAGVSLLEVEEVTFSAVYDYYNPPAEWGRPLSPASEMSIEMGSTFSDEITEAERFYTPASSTEISQIHKSPESFHTPSMGSPGGYRTPAEYPFYPVEPKRRSIDSVDSSEVVFSPAKCLGSPDDEGIETTPPAFTLDEGSFLTEGHGSLGIGTLQEKVQGIPPAFLKPLIKKKVFENDSLFFFAEVFGLPSPEVKWYRNKNQLVADERIKMERDGDNITLEILSVTKADQGEYICEAINYVGEARSVALVVVISQEARYMPAPPAVTHQHVIEFDVEEDDSSRSPSPQEILLEVELDENEVKEFERQVKIITIPEYAADNKSMIISLDVLPSMYEESGVDFVTQESDDLKIAFEVTEMPPRFINPICDMETPESTTVMFECSLMGIPSPIVSWFRGNKKIPHDDKKYFHSSDGDNHFLKIRKVTTHDSGVYTCRAINIVGETLCRASLLVLNPKAFSGKARGRELTAVSLGSAKVQPQKFDLVVGNSLFDGEQASEIELEFEFEQEADESQKAVRLVAMTDNEMSEQGEKYVSINFDVFAEPAKDDKIEFKGKSSDICSFQFQITETPPKCIIPLTNVTAALGTPVILQCLVSGKPHPTAEWYKDGDLVKDTRYMIQEKASGHFNLIITNVNQSDAGEYKCLIQNLAGCTETTALLKVF